MQWTRGSTASLPGGEPRHDDRPTHDAMPLSVGRSRQMREALIVGAKLCASSVTIASIGRSYRGGMRSTTWRSNAPANFAAVGEQQG